MAKAKQPEAENGVKELEVYRGQVSDAVATAQKLKVESHDDVAKVSDLIRAVKDVRKKVEDRKEEYTAPAKAIIATAKKDFDPIIAEAKAVEDTLKGKAQAFIVADNKRIADQEAKIAAAAAAGKISDEKALQKLDKLPDQQKSVAGGASRLTVTEYEDIEVTDEAAIPRQYLVVDLVRLKAAVLKARLDVPGVKIIKKAKTSSHGY